MACNKNVQELVTDIATKANASVTITAGNGLTGGGDLSANRTLAVGAGSGIAVAADAVSVDINGLTAEATIDQSADYVMVYDASAGALRKALIGSTQQLALGYYVAGGTANVQTITASPAWASYETGSVLSFKPVADNTGACTLNVNNLGAKSIKLVNGLDPYAGALRSDGVHIVQYDGTNFILLNPSAGKYGALVSLASNQSIANSTVTAIGFASETYDSHSIHDNSTNNSRLTVPTGVKYVRLTFGIEIEANATGVRAIGIAKNGSSNIAGLPNVIEAANNASISSRLAAGTSVLEVTSGDYFEVTAFQNSGVALNALSANNRTWFSMEILG